MSQALQSLGITSQVHEKVFSDDFAVLGFINCKNEALAKWMAHCLSGDWPVVCMDNGGMVSPDCDVVSSATNLGWGGGVNVLMKYALASYPKAKGVWVCNDDIFGASQHMGAQLLDTISHHSDVAVVSPSVEGPGNKGLWNTGKNKLLTVSFVDMVCPMFSSDAWRIVGELDLTLGVGHGLDIDWCHRAKRLGFELLRDERLTVWHPHPLTTCDAQGTTKLHQSGWRQNLEKKWGQSADILATTL